MVKQSSPIGPVIEELVVIWTATDAEEWKGQILTNSSVVKGGVD